MAIYDLPLSELERYLPDLDEPADLDEFWSTTLAEARGHDLALQVTPVPTGLRLVDVDDVTFAGFGGHPIKAWVLRPAGAASSGAPLPAVVEYLGYGGGRGKPFDRLVWATAGYAHLVMDTRGQGAGWGSGGDTADPSGSGAAHPGVMTRGIENPSTYYYRRLMTDAVRAVDAVRALPYVDPSRVAVTGVSQGGGLTLAAAGLADGLSAAMPDVPFLSHYRRAVDVTDNYPYGEIVAYLHVHRDREASVFRTLSYFDVASIARRATAPALFSTALRDQTCPPSTVFAAYNHYGDRGASRPATSIEVYPFNDHEGGESYHVERQLSWLGGLLGR